MEKILSGLLCDSFYFGVRNVLMLLMHLLHTNERTCASSKRYFSVPSSCHWQQTQFTSHNKCVNDSLIRFVNLEQVSGTANQVTFIDATADAFTPTKATCE